MPPSPDDRELLEAAHAARLAQEVTGTPEFRLWVFAHLVESGRSKTEAAELIGVDRNYAYRWALPDPVPPTFEGWSTR